MPIHPDNRHRYPADWAETSRRIRRDRAGDKCECAGQCGAHEDRCRAENGAPHPVTGSRVVLTVAHLDHQPEHSDDDNLLALCQRCHLAYDRDHHAESRRARLASRSENHRQELDAPRILSGDCRAILPTLEPASVDVVVTSPPYLKQRAYGSLDALELGREETVAEYVHNLADVFDLVRPVLKPHGWLWLNIGDKANNSGGAGGDWSSAASRYAGESGGPGRFRDPAYPEASFVDVPGALVAELLRRKWRLRMPIVWDKGREGPESLHHARRPRWAHEMIYLFTVAERPRNARAARARFYPSALTETGSVWHFPSGGNGDRHLAPFPDELARRCILPTTLPGDTVLDPFSGSGTVPRVAHELGRRGIGIELYAGDSAQLIHGNRIGDEAGRRARLERTNP